MHFMPVVNNGVNIELLIKSTIKCFQAKISTGVGGNILSIWTLFILIRKSMKLFNREMQCISFFKCMSLRRENLLIYSQPKPA